jgi:hypothetical protein
MRRSLRNQTWPVWVARLDNMLEGTAARNTKEKEDNSLPNHPSRKLNALVDNTKTVSHCFLSKPRFEEIEHLPFGNPNDFRTY